MRGVLLQRKIKIESLSRWIMQISALAMLVACQQTESPEEIKLVGFEDKSAEVEVTLSAAGNQRAPQNISMPPIPKVVTFAGDTIPLHRPDVREGLENELVVNSFRHSKTITVMRNIERWRPLIEKTLQENQVPIDFIYLAVAESEFDNNAESYVGAMGMWQFMENTGKEYGLLVNKDVDMRRDPKLATEAASLYLKKAYTQFNDWILVAASYNRGMSGIHNNMKDQQADNFFDLHLNPETARYVYRIIAFKLILENPQAYGYFLNPEENYQPYAFKTVRVEEDIDDLVSFAKDHQATYKELRLLNPWFNNTSSYKLNVPRNTAFDIRVPLRSEELTAR